MLKHGPRTAVSVFFPNHRHVSLKNIQQFLAYKCSNAVLAAVFSQYSCLTELQYHVSAYAVDSWKLSQRRVKNLQWFHAYKCLIGISNSGLLFGSSATSPSSSSSHVHVLWMWHVFFEMLRMKQIQHIQEFHIETWWCTIQNGRCWSSGVGTRLCKFLICHWKMLWIFYRIPALRFSETFLRTTKFDITRNYESSSVDCEERLWPPVVGRKSDRLTRRLRALLLAEKTWEEEHPQKKKKPRGENKSTLRMRAGNTIFYRSQVTVVRNSCRGDLCLAEKVKKQHVQTYWRRTYSLLCTLGPKSANDRLHQPVNQVPHHVTYFINQYLLMENDVI